MPDAVVIGAGPNGLVAANVLADAGWSVAVLEAQPEPGGAVRSRELTRPGFVHDMFSAFYPLAVASPVMRDLGLEEYGLRWKHAPLVVAHPGGEGERIVLSRDVDETAASFDDAHPGDGDAWRAMYDEWLAVSDHVVDVLLRPFPPIVPAMGLALGLRRDLLRFARFSLLPVRRLAEERFGGRAPAMLLAGNALHADLSPEAPLSGFFGWLLCCLGQQHGFPVPEGGAGALTAALVRRLESRGGVVLCSMPVTRVVVRDGRAVAVRTAAGAEIPARRAVLADTGAPSLYLDLVGPEHLPSAVVDDVRRFQYDNATVKVDWALHAPIPWKSEPARRAGTLHVAEGIDHLSDVATQLATGSVPARPFLVVGQMSLCDSSRSPAGTETAWAYTHVPQRIRRDPVGGITGNWDARETGGFAERLEEIVEELAPGFRELIVDRHVLTPRSLQAADANLVGGAINGGTSQLHQEVVFRPRPSARTAATPVRGLYLASASAHPGGGVHGACGANAAAAALRHDRRRRLIRGGA